MTDSQDRDPASSGLAADENSKLANVADVATSEVSDVASSAVDGVRDVVDEASAQAKAVATQARQQLERLVGQGRNEFRLQAEQRGSQAAGQLRTLSEQFTALAEGRPEGAGPLVGYLEDVQGQIRRMTSRLEQGGPQGLVDDLTSFARRRPGVFLLAAAGVGFIAGRAVRATVANQAEDGGTDWSSATDGSASTTPIGAASRNLRALP
jgi:hypothetical protein